MEVDVSDSHTNGAQVNGTVDADHTHPTVITLSLKHEKGILRRVLKHLEVSYHVRVIIVMLYLLWW